MAIKRSEEALRRYLPKFDASIDVPTAINGVANQYRQAYTHSIETQQAVLAIETSDKELQEYQEKIMALQDELLALQTLADQAKERLTQDNPELYEARDSAQLTLTNTRTALALYATIGRVQGHWDAQVPLGQVGNHQAFLRLMEVDCEIIDPLAVIQSLPHWEGMFKVQLTMGNKDYATDRRAVNDRLIAWMNEGKAQGVQLRPDTLVVDKKSSWQGTPLLVMATSENQNGSESEEVANV